MGRPKQLVPIHGQPMLRAVIDPLTGCHCINDITVVTNSLVMSELDLDGLDVSVVINDDPDAEMIDSIRVGIDDLQRRQTVEPGEGVLICPGDLPGLCVDDLTTLCVAFVRHPERLIVASHGGKRGHPLIVPASCIPLVMSEACNAGLRCLMELMSECLMLIETPNPAVLRNINTPEDLARMAGPDESETT
ncbi:MAG: nucleotidyltransferase family protein [Phycisphaeraceae bacterium]